MNTRKYFSPSPRLGFCLVWTLTALAAFANAQVNGAIQTTDVSGTTVNFNVNPPLSCDAVYLTGGPQNTNNSGLTPGTYYFRVTDPSGANVLSPDAGTATLTVALVNGKGVITTSNDLVDHPNGATDPSSGETTVRLWFFNPTPNNGGVYKAWISTDPTFTNSSTKTDNFKCTQPPPCDPTDPSCICNTDPTNPICQSPPPSASIVGTKFYDTNADGVQDNGEVGIQDWLVGVSPAAQTGTTCNLTDSSGNYLFLVDPGSGDYTITEADSIETNWVHTTPTSGIATAGEGTIQGPNFGNLCTGAGGGLTLGFWSNKNGQALESASDFTNLTALNLAKANGAAQDFTGSLSQNKTALNSFLLNANATNMANMLSAQLAAMYLNVVHGFVSGSAVLYVGNQPAGCTIPVVNGEITVSALITDANLELGAPGGNLTVASGQQRTCEEFKKTALDNANNNKNFVQPTACKHTFNTASCTF
ncbi:MAG TPA: SdrD B-like domain-containing protein [Terriglobales bacterium]|jgi:hypothetical protein|nr:SdrD B-like domain-containing protein [Terriglobales bacterium]